MNAVQFDMLCMANSNMKYNKRSWFNYSRNFESEKMGDWFKRKVGISWLSDNRGALKENGYVKAWQRGRHSENGAYAGSESRRQFTWRSCLYLLSRSVIVCREAYAAAKSHWRKPKQPKPVQEETPAIQERKPRRSKENPFLDPEFRKRKGFKTPIPKGA